MNFFAAKVFTASEVEGPPIFKYLETSFTLAALFVFTISYIANRYFTRLSVNLVYC